VRYPDRGRRFWRHECGCVIERDPEPDYGFTDVEVGRFKGLLTARGCDDQVAAELAGRLLNSLAHYGTKVVLGLPAGDIVITAQDGSEAIGRPLPANEGPSA
jgi:hypothetical protein